MWRAVSSLLVGVLSAGSCVAQPSPAPAPQIIAFPSGGLHLKAYLWNPSGSGPFPAVIFNHGSGGDDAAHTAGLPISEAAARLAPIFLRHGYAFMYPFRRGQGLSWDQAPFMQDLLQREEAAKGKESRQHLQFVLMSTEQLDDVLAAVLFLKSAPGIDAHRIAVAGHSFGAQLTLLAAERDASLRAAVTFGAAARSWPRSPELRARLLAALRGTTAAVMLIHAANDYGTAAGTTMAAELERLQQPYVLKIYAAVGRTADDGHNFLYSAIPLWEGDVFRFLDAHTKH